MARDWLKKPKTRGPSLSELIAAKDYPNAIEVLRSQLQKRPGMQTRLQLADLLLLAGRRDEAMTIFIGLADELTNDGFVAKAVAILKRIDRLEPGRADIERRLAQLASQPVRERAMSAVTPAPLPLTPPPATLPLVPPPPLEPPVIERASERESTTDAAAVAETAEGGSVPGLAEWQVMVAEPVEPPPAVVVEPAEPVEPASEPMTPAPDAVAVAALDSTPAAPVEAAPSPESSTEPTAAPAVEPAAEVGVASVPETVAAPEPLGPPAPAKPPEEKIGGLGAIWKRLLTALPKAASAALPASVIAAPAAAPVEEPGTAAADPASETASAPAAVEGETAAEASPSADAATTMPSEPAAPAEAATLEPVMAEAAAEAVPGVEAAAPTTVEACSEPTAALDNAPTAAPPLPAAAAAAVEIENAPADSTMAEAPTAESAPAAKPASEEPEAPRVEAAAVEDIQVEPLAHIEPPAPAEPPPIEPPPIEASPAEAAPAEAAAASEAPPSAPEAAAAPEPAAAEATPAEENGPPAEPAAKETETTLVSGVPIVIEVESMATETDAAASPAVVEKLGGVFKRFLAALPEGDAATPSEAAAQDPSQDLADALAAVGLDGDELDDQAFFDSFIDDDELEAAVEPTVEPEAPAEPAPLPMAVAPPKWTAPMNEAGFRDQVLDLIEEVLKRPPEVGPAAPGEGTEPIASAYRDELLAHPLFRDLSEEAMLAMLHALRLVCCEAGEIIVSEGEPGASLFLLISGSVKLFVRNPIGHNIQVGRLTEGTFFGEMSLLSGRPRNATLTAADRVELLELPKPLLDAIAHTHPHVRDVVDELYLQRANSPEVAAARNISTGDSKTREQAMHILKAYFGGRRWEPRMQLKLATVLLKSGKEEEAVPVLVDLADTLLREGDATKAITILKKVELIRRRSLKFVNLAPLASTARARPAAAAPAVGSKEDASAPAWMGRTEGFFGDWLTTFRRSVTSSEPAPRRSLPGYGPGLVASPLFEDFSEEDLLVFMQGLRLMVFEPGDVILTEGEPGESVFILSTGTVKVFVRNPKGHDVELCELDEGAFIGEISTLSGRPRSATITAGSRCELLELDRPTLEAIVNAHPRMRQVLEEVYIERASSPEAERIRTSGPPPA